MPIQKNYSQIKCPRQWVSAYQPINYLFDAPTENGTFTNNLGFVQVYSGVFRNLDTLLQPGDLIYITAGVYKGYHTVKQIIGYGYNSASPTSVTYTINTVFTTNDGGTIRDIKYMQPPVFSVYKGWQTGEVPIGVSPNPYPFLKVADFSPEGNRDGFLEINISGYVQSALLPIVPPKKGLIFFGADNGYNLYMPFRVVFSSTVTTKSYLTIHKGLCAGTDTEDLFSKYVSTKQYLAESIAISSCLTKFATYINGSILTTFRFENQSIPRSTFNDRFNSRFLNT
jgi:hypothetical protein